MFDIDIKKLRFENNLSQADLGKILNVTKQQISKIETGKAKLSKKNFILLQNHFKNLKTPKNQDEFIEIDYFENDLSLNTNGSKSSKIKVSLGFLPFKKDKKYFICHQKGNSMEPYIYDGDFLVVERKSNKDTIETIEDGTIYLFSYEDKIYVKKLSLNIHQIVVKSLNSDFPIQYINNDEFKKISLFGKIVCYGRFSSFKN